MANYLERVASSAGRRAAIAKPPNSGPPVLPAGRDFSIAPADPFASDEEQLVETLETVAPARTEERVDTPSAPKPRVADTATQDEPVSAAVQPQPRPSTSVERLSSESPFTVHVPRTLRTSVAAKVPTTTTSEQPHEQTRARATANVGAEEIIIETKPADSQTNEVKVTAETDRTSLTPRPRITERVEQHQTSVRTEAALTETTPAPRVDRVDGPARYSAEPSPPPASPVHLPPVAGNSARQEQSRIHIGSLEVLVNNHPRVTTARPAAAPSRSERLNLEKRYLDRFRLRH